MHACHGALVIAEHVAMDEALPDDWVMVAVNEMRVSTVEA